MAQDERPVGRYSRRRVILEIEEQLTRRKRGAQKALAAELDVPTDYISKRQTDVDYHWSIEDIGRIADAWRAPTDWPWIPWDLAAQRDEAWAEYQKRKNRG